MKNSIPVKVVSVFCIVAMIFALAVGLNFMMGTALAEKYNVGNAEIGEPVKNLEIDWTNGKVAIAYHSGNTVIISETADKTIKDSEKMRWLLDGDTLRIKYEKPGAFHLFSSLSKELTVTLPEGFAFDKAEIHATSGDLDIPAIQADKLELKVTSGNIRAEVKARKIKANLTSGDMGIRIAEKADEIDASATSGNITMEAVKADKVRIDTTSGDVRAAIKHADGIRISSTSGSVDTVIGEANKAEVETTSGKINVEAAALRELAVRSTSGDVTALLPSEPGFTARVKTSSGDIEYQQALAKKDGVYVCGDGSGKVDIKTTSGDIAINILEKK